MQSGSPLTKNVSVNVANIKASAVHLVGMVDLVALGLYKQVLQEDMGIHASAAWDDLFYVVACCQAIGQCYPEVSIISV